MPLLIEGNINGQEYNKPVSVKEFAKLLGLTELLEREKINIVQTKVKPDRLNGGHKHPESISLPCMFSATGPGGNTLQVRYYEQRVEKLQNGNRFYDYNPKKTRNSKMPIVGKEIIANKIQNIELAMYYATHPKCRTSPFWRPGMEHYFEVDFPEKRAKKRASEMQRLVSVQASIFEMEERTLRMAAKGINLNIRGRHEKVYNVDGLTLEELQVKMVDLAQKDLDQFVKQLESGEFKMYGFLNDALDKGIIKLSKPSSAGRYYEWTVGKGGRICNVGLNDNPVIVLRKYFIENMSSMVPVIKNHLAEKEVKGMASSPDVIENFEALLEDKPNVISNITEDSNEEDIFYALSKRRLIDYDPDTRNVVLVEKNGTPQERAFVASVENENEWTAEAIDRIKTNKVFRRRAVGHLNDNL